MELLNFQSVENKSFQRQLAFNLLPKSNSAADGKPGSPAALATLLGERMPPVGIAAVQAPVFHSHAFSVF